VHKIIDNTLGIKKFFVPDTAKYWYGRVSPLPVFELENRLKLIYFVVRLQIVFSVLYSHGLVCNIADLYMLLSLILHN
jgi:hypothetical protein